MKLLPNLIELGFALTASGDTLIVTPASKLTDALRHEIRTNKQELIADLRIAERLTAAVIASIKRACEARGDDDTNRAGLIEEVRQLPSDLQEDARQHFDGVTRDWRAACGRLPS